METKLKIGRNEVVVRENFVDRAVNFVSPVRGNARFKARATHAIAGGYAGASKTRRSLKEWNPLGHDANSDLLPSLQYLRQRSSDLVRNSPLAAGAINTACTSIIGQGLKLQAEVDAEAANISDEEAQQWGRTAERLFNLWGNSKDCDITRTQNFAELQDLVLRSTLERGDIFSLLPNKIFKGSPFKLKVQLIEADRVENKDFGVDTPMQSGGIQMDNSGAPVAVHILKGHPGNIYASNREWYVVPVFGALTGRRNVLHHYKKLRPGQSRGVPYLAPVIETLKQLERYTEAELMAAVISGMFTVFIKTASDQDLDIFEPSSETGGSTADEDYKFGNGTVVSLGPDDEIDTANPGRPNSEFDPFITSILRQVGVALEMPYEVLIKHFTASYSAARASLLEAWRFFNSRRVWVSNSFCQPVYEAFIDEQVADGRLNAPGYFNDPLIRAGYLGAKWIGRPQGQIDPLKENNADVIAEDRGWKTAQENTAEKTGGDWFLKHKQRTKENALRKESGSMQPEETAQATAQAALPLPVPEEDQTDEGLDDS